MPAELKQRLQALMINLKNSEEGRKILKQALLSAFNPVTNKDYDPHREIVEAVYGR
jgi:ABC-type phosphate/phosphonate transport system substrate-binding protein